MGKTLTTFKLNIQYRRMRLTHAWGPHKDPQLLSPRLLSRLPSSRLQAALTHRAVLVCRTHLELLTCGPHTAMSWGQCSPGEGYRGTSLLQEEREQLALQVCPFLCCSDHPNDHPWSCCGFGGDRSIHPAGRGPSVRSLDATKAFSCHKRLQVPAAQESYLPWVSSILLSVCLFSGCQEGRMSRTFEILETLLGSGSISSGPTRAGP